MLHIRRSAVAALAALAVLVGVGTLTAAGSKHDDGSTVTKLEGYPDMDLMVLRNGKYHQVKVPGSAKKVKDAKGGEVTSFTPDPDYEAKINAQLPPEDKVMKARCDADATLPGCTPTDAEIDAARRAVGVEASEETKAGDKVRREKVEKVTP